MNDTTLICQNDEQRRRQVRDDENYNGIDYLEVSDDQLTLMVFFLDQAPKSLEKENVRIEGGRRITDIEVVGLELCSHDDAEADDCMKITVDKPGDFSLYTLRLVELDEEGRPTDEPFAEMDRRYAQLQFSFKEGCPSDLDCKPREVCPPPERMAPEINYLAKDYASFRQLILDRLSQIMPGWKERHAPDLGITLTEIFAYAGDYLSYYQDAVATEAYLGTARQRISIRRHARLVDYPVHEGCNARAWVAVKMDADDYASFDPQQVYFITPFEGAPEIGKILTPDDLRQIPANSYEVFEPLVETPQARSFRFDDFKNLACLTKKLCDPTDALSKYIYERLSADTLELLCKRDKTKPPSRALQKALNNDFNRLLESGNLYEQQRFQNVPLTPETLELLARKPEGKDLMRLNRWLLEEAFPNELSWSQRGYLYFYKAHDEMLFYTWGEKDCCLPHGATSATLQDQWIPVVASHVDEPYTSRKIPQPQAPSTECWKRELQLKVGDVLIFEELIGPKTGDADDADHKHRHAVRLTRVELSIDPVIKTKIKISEVDYEVPTPVVEIAWAEEDKLPFPLCISAIGPAPECVLLTKISVARGNVVLVDHGRRVKDDLGKVAVKATLAKCKRENRPEEIVFEPEPFRPILKKTPLTFSQPLPANAPASELIVQDSKQAVAQIKLNGACATPAGLVEDMWIARPDLLGSRRRDCHFVVEMDNDGHAHLRFGDDDLGRMPEAGTIFSATYRIGNGLAGNVGAETISYFVLRSGNSNSKLSPRNPLPAQGGVEPQPLAEVKLFAPTAFRKKLERAITTDDYARLAERHPKVQRAAAIFRWTGSWYEVLVAIDPLGQVEAEPELLDEIAQSLFRYRRMGHDLVVKRAQYVPLDIAMTVCVLPGYARGHVKAALLDVFSDETLPDGRRGFFHPDHLTFGQGIRLSKLIATAQAVTGVESVSVTKLERLFKGPNQELENGILPLSVLEIARLDNDPSFPENGRLELTVLGGR